MIIYVVQLVVSSLVLLLMARMVNGVEISSWGSALFGAFIIGLVNAFIKPIMVFLTFPITVVTLGLFLLVVNALMLQLAAALSPGIRVSGFGPAILGSIVLTILNLVLSVFLPV